MTLINGQSDAMHSVVEFGLVRLEVSFTWCHEKYCLPRFAVTLIGRKQSLCKGLERLFEERLDLRQRQKHIENECVFITSCYLLAAVHICWPGLILLSVCPLYARHSEKIPQHPVAGVWCA